MIALLRQVFFFMLFAVYVLPSAASAGRSSVLVNPNGAGQGTVKTITEGIAMVDPGGKVMVLPGTYNEAIVIDKGLTLKAVGGKSGAVIVEPPGAPTIAVQITTSAPVVIRGLTVRYSGVNGIRGEGAVDVTIEDVTVIAVNPPLGVDRLISVNNDASVSKLRAKLVVRDSFLDGSIACSVVPAACTFDPLATFPQTFGVIAGGDVDMVVERNVIRRTGGACIFVVVRNDLGGEVNAQILDNDLDECHPLGRAGAIFVAPSGTINPTTEPVAAKGIVDIVGNTIRNSSRSCLTSTAISYIVFGGRIERNRIEGVVQPCASDTLRARPAGIWLGSRFRSNLFPRVDVKVRFNDIVGNAQAGLRVAQNMTPAIDASCNWWNDASGPSGAGPGSGDALVVEPGASPPGSNMPLFVPWAVEPIAETGEEDGEHGDRGARGAGGEDRAGEPGAGRQRGESRCD